MGFTKTGNFYLILRFIIFSVGGWFGWLVYQFFTDLFVNTSNKKRTAGKEYTYKSATGGKKEDIDKDATGRGGSSYESSNGGKEYICPILNAKFVLIPAGTFMMGSSYDIIFKEEGSFDEVPHQVTISKPFYMQTTEVTQKQWKNIMGNNPSICKGDDNLPVELVSWNDVQDFLCKINKLIGTDKYFLPTEAQWEYACRAGSTSAYFFGDDRSYLTEYAWYKDNSENTTHPVGQKKANVWGLYDMYGNVREWCQELYGHYTSESVTDPKESDRWHYRWGTSRVVRGGCCFDESEYCRSAVRFHHEPYDTSMLGFRLIRSL